MNIKELSLPDLLDLMIRLYLRNFWLFFSISVVSLVPTLVFSLTYQPFITESLLNIPSADVALPLLLSSVILALISTWVTGASIKAVEAVYLNDGIKPLDAFRAVGPRYFSLLWAGILYVLAISFGLLIIVPGIWLAVAYVFASQSIVIEDLPGRAGIGRSRTLVKGSWWRVAGYFLVITVLIFILQAILSIPFGIVSFAGLAMNPAGTQDMFLFVTQAGSAVTSAILAPLSVIGSTLLYYDLRVRREGLDLWARAEALTEETELTR